MKLRFIISKNLFDATKKLEYNQSYMGRIIIEQYVEIYLNVLLIYQTAKVITEDGMLAEKKGLRR